MANCIDWKPGDNVVIPDIEFPANVYPWWNLKLLGVETRFVRAVEGRVLLFCRTTAERERLQEIFAHKKVDLGREKVDLLVGGLSRGFPRGYFDKAYATGQHLVAGSAAYRFPVYRPFEGFGTTPFRDRQISVETFFDSGKVSDDNPGGDGEWFSSVGIEIHVGIEFADQILQPGIGIAYQLDGDKDVQAYFSFSLTF